MRVGTAAGLVSALFLTSPAAGADPRWPARPSVRSYTERDGLPQGTIHAIAFDRDGFLWVGTQDGAARFNGRSWTSLDMPGKAVSNFVRAVLPTRDGSLWLGREEGGLVRISGVESAVFDRAEGLPAGRVNHLFETGNGQVWVATHGGGVARFTGTRFAPVSDGLPDLRVWRLLEARSAAGSSRLLAACEGGVAELGADGRWVPIELGAPLAGVSVNSLLETGEGPARTLWVGTFGAGLFSVRDGTVTRYDASHGLESRFITALAATPGPRGAPIVWAGTRDSGVFRLEGKAFERVTLGARATEVYSLEGGVGADAETLWVGTRLSGILRVQAAPWVAFDRASGLPGDQVFSFLEAPGPEGRQALWIGTSEGVALIEEGRPSMGTAGTGLPSSQVRSLVEVRSSGGGRNVWASIAGSGLYRRVGTRWAAVDARPAFRSDDAGVLLAAGSEDGEAELWVGTEKSGLGRLSRGRWSALGVAQGLPSDSVLSLLETRGGSGRTLWVGTRGGGVAEVVAGRVVAIHDRGSGLPNNHVLSLAEVVWPEGGRELWAGTRGGVARRPLDEPGAVWSVLSESTRPALPNNSVHFVAPGRDGHVYLGTNRGVARLSRRAAGGPAFEVVTFGTNEGLPSAACNPGSAVDAHGRVWVATAAGAAVFDPNGQDASARRPHPLVVERFEVGGVPRPLGASVRLAPEERNVAFEFSLLAFHGESLIRYRTQLAGWEAAPSEWVSSSRREFTNLPPGPYVFRVWGRDADATVAGPVEVRFDVRESPWRSPAALVLWAVLAALLGIAAIRVYERALRRRAEELEALVGLRTRELSEARDAAEAATRSKSRYLAHMSHEVRTPLNAILGYSEMLAEEMDERGLHDLLPDLEKIRRAAGQQLALVTEALDLGKIEAGKAELHLTEFDAGRLIRETAETAWPLIRKGHNRIDSSGVESLGTVLSDEGKLRQVLLNLLSNAARFTERGTVFVEAARTENELTVRVRDTGIGMTPEQLERVFTPYAQAGPGTSGRYGGTGLGLVISRAYCELMRGSLDVNSVVGEGTTFTVRVPVRVERRSGTR
jgi:signal transduction histidine kinase/ligand-binding sensor domain-containing protein